MQPTASQLGRFRRGHSLQGSGGCSLLTHQLEKMEEQLLSTMSSWSMGRSLYSFLTFWSKKKSQIGIYTISSHEKYTENVNLI